MMDTDWLAFQRCHDSVTRKEIEKDSDTVSVYPLGVEVFELRKMCDVVCLVEPPNATADYRLEMWPETGIAMDIQRPGIEEHPVEVKIGSNR